MKSIAQPLPGAHLLEPAVFRDRRGEFVKTFHAPAFAALGLAFTPAEEFFSVSGLQVLRGMHFQRDRAGA
jgi:dTDP-4-dehydrorhamnose 3,5-epimerase